MGGSCVEIQRQFPGKREKNRQAGVCLKSAKGIKRIKEMGDIDGISRDIMHQFDFILIEAIANPEGLQKG